MLVIADSHETLGVHYQARPHYRFFSSLLSNLASIEGHLGAAYPSILVALRYVTSAQAACISPR